MVEFFLKIKYLVDYLHGLVDIHNHILPGIDDGAKTVDESTELIQGFSEFGVTHFICTPHIMHHHYDNNPKTIKNANDSLQKGLKKKKMNGVSIKYAAEHMIDDNFENILEQKQVLGLSEHHLLIEMSYLQPAFNFDYAVDQIIGNNFFPVLAHPERYMYFHQKYGIYTKMKADGIQFQLNLLSLGQGSYGKEVQKMAERLLKDQMIDYVGSDVHNIRQLERLKEIRLKNGTLHRLLPVIQRTIETFY
jgi:tyrosine-protein phosphatase YwqE